MGFEYKSVILTKPIEVISQATCDFCGKEMKKSFDDVPGFIESKNIVGGTNFNIHFGYGSCRHDMELYELVICDDCFEKHLLPKAKLLSSNEL